MRQFKPGETVQVDERYPHPPCHVRTPFYIRGKTGVIERICGDFRNPEDLAFGKYDGETNTLYRVRFAQKEVWPDYAEDPRDTIDIEIYEHWLKPAG
jgi:hypothetical protein